MASTAHTGLQALLRCLEADHDPAALEEMEQEGGLSAVWESGYQAALADIEGKVAAMRRGDGR